MKIEDLIQPPDIAICFLGHLSESQYMMGIYLYGVSSNLTHVSQLSVGIDLRFKVLELWNSYYTNILDTINCIGIIMASSYLEAE